MATRIWIYALLLIGGATVLDMFQNPSGHKLPAPITTASTVDSPATPLVVHRITLPLALVAGGSDVTDTDTPSVDGGATEASANQ